MRFKLFYNEQKETLDINCLPDSFNDIILPDNVEQHVYYPIPKELGKQIKTEMMELIDQEDGAAIEEIRQQMLGLVQARKDLVNRLREKYNPLIMEKCKQFRDDNAEYFI